MQSFKCRARSIGTGLCRRISEGIYVPSAVGEAEARARAIENAGTRAADLGALSGVELGPVMSISEVVGGGPTPMGLTVERAMAGGGSISPGEVEVNYQIQVVYFIEP